VNSSIGRIPVQASRSGALVLGLCVALSGCSCEGKGSSDGESAQGSSGPYSALLISLDTTRADALSCYGARADVTPHLDALARDSVLYETATTVTPVTLPSHVSMLTGLYPIRHGVRVNALNPLPDSAQTIAEAAQDAGFQTGAFVASLVLDKVFGAGQGFEHYTQPARQTKREGVHFATRTATEVIDDALGWLGSRDRSRNFFAWVHLYDAHAPHTPTPFAADPRDIPRLYLGEVNLMDRELERLFAALREDGSLDHTLVVVVADHGEAFGEHNETSHGSQLYESTLHIPFLVRYPDRWRAGTRSRELVSVVDVGPTLAEAMGVAFPADVDGTSLFRRSVPADRGLYFENYTGYVTFNVSPEIGWRDAGGKYLHSSEPRFFELATDPREEKDLAAAKGRELDRYREAIQRVAGRTRLESSGPAALGPEMQAQIAKLGYTTFGNMTRALPEPLETVGLPSPAAMAKNLTDTQYAMEQVGMGELVNAELRLRSVLLDHPRNWQALDYQAHCLTKLNRLKEAIAPLEILLREGPVRVGTYSQLALAYYSVGRKDDAIAMLVKVMEIERDSKTVKDALVQWLKEVGREEESKAVEARGLQGLQKR
jgi:arylsulfatase A-like enzyme